METLLPILIKILKSDYIPHLPPLLDTRPTQDRQDAKNLSRAFSAFALSKICAISNVIAAKAVVDDFDDFGIDAIYYHGKEDTLYFVQSKLKSSKEFKQGEALAYCQGIRKLFQQDFDGFNKNVLDRKIEIEDALDNCSAIILVIAHVGAGISDHAKKAVEELIADDSHGEERLQKKYIDYNAARVIEDIRETKAFKKVTADIWMTKCSMIENPKTTYFGLVDLVDLVEIHKLNPVSLYAKNIRTFLGTGNKSDVNTSIQQTLATNPEHFLFFNNGITALADSIEPKSHCKNRGGKKKLKLHGLSIVNGAQTISSAANFITDHKGTDISKARVTVTIIKSNCESDFGKSVTKARNHQNPVSLADFVALDDEQERLRRDLAHICVSYNYKAGLTIHEKSVREIHVNTAAHALALLDADPRFVVWLKKEPSRLLDTGTAQYKSLFNSKLTAFKLANSITFSNYVQDRISNEETYATGQTKLIYRHSNLVLSWIFAKKVSNAINATNLIAADSLRKELSSHFDSLRQIIHDTSQRYLKSKGPLSFFRNQGDVIPLMQECMIQDFGLTADPVVAHKKKQQDVRLAYPKDLFEYLISKAPQIGNLS